jgi:hypothetical protein
MQSLARIDESFAILETKKTLRKANISASIPLVLDMLIYTLYLREKGK